MKHHPANCLLTKVVHLLVILTLMSGAVILDVPQSVQARTLPQKPSDIVQQPVTAPESTASEDSAVPSKSDLLQFRAGGQVLGFQRGGWYTSNGT
ncbi:MAG: hypothetical protein JXB38_01300, partial [Anaerolineales bacterium]|nr:hypothetical protein [Anaerolineales bacterium]